MKYIYKQFNTLIMKRLSLLLPSILVIISCTKSNPQVDDPNSPELKIYPNITQSASTKALYDDVQIKNTTICVQVSKSDGTTAYTSNNKYTLQYNAGTTKWVLSTPLNLTTDNANLYAYAPEDAAKEVGSYSSLQRKLDISSTPNMTEQVDYLWAFQDKTIDGGINPINFNNSGVQLKLKHALAQIAIVMYRDNFPGLGLLSKFKITDTLNRLKVKNTSDLLLNISDGSIVGGDNIQSITINSISKTISRIEDPSNTNDPDELVNYIDAYSLIVPTNIADNKSKISFTFTIDAVDYSVTLPAGSVNWEAGKQYFYKVKLSGRQLVIDGVAVADWEKVMGDDLIVK